MATVLQNTTPAAAASHHQDPGLCHVCCAAHARADGHPCCLAAFGRVGLPPRILQGLQQLNEHLYNLPQQMALHGTWGKTALTAR
jgi:hypothetical protein